MMSLTPELRIEFNHYELIHLIDSLHSSVMTRLYFAVAPEAMMFRSQVPVEYLQRAMESLTALYHRAWNLYQSEVADDPDAQDTEWEAMRSITDEQWDLMTTIAEANSWDQVPNHPLDHADCNVCDAILASIVVG